jgi:polyhydroxyalkanoate synthesis regulator phasin
MIGFPSRNPLEETNMQRNYPLQQQQVIQKPVNPLVTGGGQTQTQGQQPPRTGMAGLFDKLNQRSSTTGLSGLENFAQALDAVILPELRAGEAIRERGAQRVKAGDVNKTIEYLEANGMADMAAIIKANPSAAGNVLSAIAANRLKAPKDNSTNLMKNYEFMRAKGLSHEEALAQIKSGTTINLGEKGNQKFLEALNKGKGTELAAQMEAGAKATEVNYDLQVLFDLAGEAPTGAVKGRFAEMFPEFNDYSAVRQSIIKRVAPTLRVEGSGSTSDIEFEGMIAGLGRLTNSQEANQAIVGIMIEKNNFNIARARIINDFWESGADMSKLPEMNKRIRELEDKLQIEARMDTLKSKYGIDAPEEKVKKVWNIAEQKWIYK